MGKVLSFKKYRALCDAASEGSYRKLGIIDLPSYKAAIQDSRTIFAAVLDEEMVPVLAAVSHVGGYDGKRAALLAGSDNMLLLCVPLALAVRVLTADIVGRAKGACVLIETPIELTEAAQKALPALFTIDPYRPWQVHQFEDPRCPQDRQNANISMYEATFAALDSHNKLIPDSGDSLIKTARQMQLEEGVRMISARDLHEDPHLLAELWDLCAHKFDMLGQFHPVSMEETQSFFEKMLGGQHTYSLVRFAPDEKGTPKPVAHGFFMSDLSGAVWVNDVYIDRTEAAAAKKHEKIIFFHGIVSRSTPEVTMHYSASIMRSMAHVAKQAGGRYRLLFESTNLSSTYVPRLVQQYTTNDPDGATLTQPIRRVTGVDYWYIKTD